MKRIFLVLPLFILLFIIGVFVAQRWWVNNSSAISSDKSPKYFVVPKGKSASEVGVRLYEQGLIKSPLAFKIYVQIFGKANKINAGEFRLSENYSLAEIIEALQGGPLELWVTIPEGLRKEEIVDIFIESLQKGGAEEIVFKEDFLRLTKEKEGYLFPDTYLFPPEVDAVTVVERLTQTFENKVNDSMRAEIQSGDYTLDEIVIMASILERETVTDEERPIVAGILWKRLETPGWLVQADATVQYAIANERCAKGIDTCEWWPILTREDLEIDSSYNSYKFKPLPPTPIANPGISSIDAAINSQRSDYWFYIHDPDGQIHYAETIEKHNSNVRKYLGK